MAFIDNVLQEPSYKWADESGELVVPTKGQIIREAFKNVNLFKTKKNWIPAILWITMICMLPAFYGLVFVYFSWKLLLVVIFYSMIVMGTHGTIWYHRYCTHKAYKFSHPIWRIITQNLVIKTLPEESYVISHHVHHVKSDEPGDPYNAKAGFLYCMLSDVNHQALAKNLTEIEYNKAVHFMRHTGVRINTYKEYQKWGSVASPVYTVAGIILNWAFWGTALFFLGGPGLVCAVFTAALLWFVLVPAFNYSGHGGGKVKHMDGVDFDRSNLSINQTRPGLFAGEWHNNHHLYPGSARAGFLPHQIDLAWIYIWILYKIGGVSSYHCSRKDFMKKYITEKTALVAEQKKEAVSA